MCVIEYKRRLYLFLHRTQIALVASFRSCSICKSCKHMQVYVYFVYVVYLKLWRKFWSAFNDGDDYNDYENNNNGLNKFSSFDNEVSFLCAYGGQSTSSFLRRRPEKKKHLEKEERKPKFDSIDKCVCIFFHLFRCNWMKIIFIRSLKCLPNSFFRNFSPSHCLIEWNNISFVCCNFYLFTITKRK